MQAHATRGTQCPTLATAPHNMFGCKLPVHNTTNQHAG